MDEYQRAQKYVLNTLEESKRYLKSIRDEIISRALEFGAHPSAEDDGFIEDLTWVTLDYIDWTPCEELECVMNKRFEPIVNVCDRFNWDEDVQAAVIRIVMLEG